MDITLETAQTYYIGDGKQLNITVPSRVEILLFSLVEK